MQQEAIQEDFYSSLSASGESLFKDRGSKFIGLAVKVKNSEEALAALQTIREQYHDARHHCFAYRTKPLQPQCRFNDDGEPSNSAGSPIFNQMVSVNVWNVLVVVVRYFGGTKLGVPGLINAYKTAAKEALENASTKTVYIFNRLEIRFPYNQTGVVMQTLKNNGAKIATEKMAADAGYEIKVRLSKKDSTLAALKKLHFLKITEDE